MPMNDSTRRAVDRAAATSRRGAQALCSSSPLAAALLLASTWLGCGKCPDDQVVPAQPAYVFTTEYALERGDGGTLEIWSRLDDGSLGAKIPCDASCLAAFEPPRESCEAMCLFLNDELEISECAFDAEQASLSCTRQVPERPESCRCHGFLNC